METLQRIWQENKRFLLICGSALALFSLLNSCGINGMLKAAGDKRKDNQKEEGKVNKLRSDVKERYPEEKKSLEDLVEIEKDLRARFLTPPPQNPPDPRGGGAAQIQFSERIDRIWTEVREKANQKNVKLPEKISTETLGVRSEDGPEDHQRNASYLEVLGRALHACVDHGITQIEKPSIAPEEERPIRENEDALVLYRRVGLQVQGPYGAFRRILREFQKPGSTVQVRLLSLDAKGAGGTASLRGQLEFTGVFLWREGEVEKPAEEKTVEKPGKKRRKKK